MITIIIIVRTYCKLIIKHSPPQERGYRQYIQNSHSMAKESRGPCGRKRADGSRGGGSEVDPSVFPLAFPAKTDAE